MCFVLCCCCCGRRRFFRMAEVSPVEHHQVNISCLFSSHSFTCYKRRRWRKKMALWIAQIKIQDDLTMWRVAKVVADRKSYTFLMIRRKKREHQYIMCICIQRIHSSGGTFFTDIFLQIQLKVPFMRIVRCTTIENGMNNMYT